MIHEQLLASLREAWPVICPNWPKEVRLFKLSPGELLHDYSTLRDAAHVMRWRRGHDPIPADMGMMWTVLAKQGLHSMPGQLGVYPGDTNTIHIVVIVKAAGGGGWLNAHAHPHGERVELPVISLQGTEVHGHGHQAIKTVRECLRP